MPYVYVRLDALFLHSLKKSQFFFQSFPLFLLSPITSRGERNPMNLARVRPERGNM